MLYLPARTAALCSVTEYAQIFVLRIEEDLDEETKADNAALFLYASI